MNGTADDEFVNVPVPRRYYSVVVAAVADAQRNEYQESAGDTSLERTWTKADLDKLKSTINQTGKALMNAGADRPGDWISFQDVQQRAGQSDGSARAGLAGLTRHVKRYYRRANWPCEIKWGEQLGFDKQMYYRLNVEIAKWWRAA